jgi:hypothetical protein
MRWYRHGSSLLVKTTDEPYACFRAMLEQALSRVEREGELPSIAGEIGVYTSTESGLSLTVVVSADEGAGRVIAARHRGANDPWSRAICDSFCQLVEGMPLQEAAEHGVVRLLDRMRDPEQSPPVPGIITPRNAGAEFALVERMIRAIYAEYLAHTNHRPEWNRWNPRMPAGWVRLRKEEQMKLLTSIVALQLQDEGFTLEDAWISNFQSALKVTISFGPRVSSADKPDLLMRIERRMRAGTGARLEVYAEEMRDRNAIRRL